MKITHVHNFLVKHAGQSGEVYFVCTIRHNSAVQFRMGIVQ